MVEKLRSTLKRTNWSLLLKAVIFGVAWWALQQFTLPAPIRMLVILVIAIIVIIFLASLLQGGPGLGFSGLRLGCR